MKNLNVIVKNDFKFIYYGLLTCFLLSNLEAMRIDYQYDDDEEYHNGVVISLENKDTNPNSHSMTSNYNRLGAAILKGASEDNKRYIHIKNINNSNFEFTRALMKKAYEIASSRSVPITMSFFNTIGGINSFLETEWLPIQQEVDKFYVDPYHRLMYGEEDLSD